MHGIVSLLDAEHEARVLALWEELGREFGLGARRKTPFPHLSYQGALGYADEDLEARLRVIAVEQPAFKVTADGLGVFTGAAPVLYIPVLRTAELAALQRRVWEVGIPMANGADEYFRPESWTPHITLAMHDLDAERLGQAIRHLGTRELRWEIQMDNLAYIDEDVAESSLRWRIRLRERDPDLPLARHS
ncbi:MAG TPA: 2'-5' RNA ligase family protein [Ktedonobacterales bacterium]|jgi:2'-5' RNA ligase|nr:2'-5' RNA ligase family protein [Ktedonobacterales bacterium]